MTTATDLPALVWTKLEVAQMLKCGLTKVTSLISSGELTSIKIGGTRLIRHADLLEYVASRPVESSTAAEAA